MPITPATIYTLVPYKAANREWRWRMVAGNGEIVADSAEGYTRKTDCLRAMKTLQAAVIVVSEEVKS